MRRCLALTLAFSSLLFTTSCTTAARTAQTSPIAATAPPVSSARTAAIASSATAASRPASGAPTAPRARSLAQADDGLDGKVTVEYEVPKTASHKEAYRILKSSKVFDALARAITKRFKLPEDLKVVFTECDEENAFYSPQDHSISMCYELIDKYRLAYTDDKATPEDVRRETINAALFTFYHELGHAMVDLLELSATGREEDVVDEFAVIMLLQAGDEEGMEAVYAAINQFAMDAEETKEDYAKIDDLPFWDVHSLDQQRFYDLLCLLYGSDPKYFADLVKDGDLPKDRADGCPDEFERKAAVWDKLLAPHLRGATSSRMHRAQN